jgi:plastocyanin
MTPDRPRRIQRGRRSAAGRWAGLGIALLTALAAAGCGSGTAGSLPSPVPTSRVDLPRSYVFSPAHIVVPAGTTVTWTNDDVFTHSVLLNGEAGLGQVIHPGESTTITFRQPGTYHYVCAFHPQNMAGWVTVVPAG